MPRRLSEVLHEETLEGAAPLVMQAPPDPLDAVTRARKVPSRAGEDGVRHERAKGLPQDPDEAATYEQRKVGDKYYLTITPNGATEPVTHEFRVVGVLDRTGSQDDGTTFMPFSTAQKLFNRPQLLTIVGVKRSRCTSKGCATA